MVFMQLFQILNQIVYPLRVQKLVLSAGIFPLWKIPYLSDDLRGFGIINCFQILLHGTIVICLLIQKIPVLSKDHILLVRIHAGLLRQIDSRYKEVPLIQYLKSLRKWLLVIAVDL